MIELPRSVARTIRAVFRRLAPKGATPVVSFMAGIGGLFVRLHRTDILAEYHLEGDRPPEEITLPFAAFAAFEGRNGTVTLESTGPGTVQARWSDAGVPQVVDYEATDMANLTPHPAPPESVVAMPDGFLAAMADASQCTSRDNPRYALTHLHLRGGRGTIVATDGRHLLTQAGFSFPWQDDVLVPATSLFGCKELQGQPVQLGHTETHVVLSIGPWRFLLPIEKNGRYPHTDEVIPKASSVASTAHLDADDCAYLTRVLPRLPGADDDDSPVTIDLGATFSIRARAKSQNNHTEVGLARSQATGKPVRFAINRSYLQRALELGFAELAVGNAETPVVFRDDSRQYVVMPLSKDSALAPREDAIRLSTTEAAPNSVKETIPVKETVSHANGASQNGMPSTEATAVATNGTTPPSNGARRRKTKSSGLAALIVEAEALKTSLRAAFSRSHALLIALKKHRRQSQIVQTTLKSLKELQTVE